MGRKSKSKQVGKKNVGKDSNKFILQKRKELLILTDKLLKLTSTLQASTNLNRSGIWEHHLEIDTILREINSIETMLHKNETKPRQQSIDYFLKWLQENGVENDGIEISEFEGYEYGLKATKEFPEGSLILTVPEKLMMTELDAQKSELSQFITIDPLLQNMPNIELALFLLLEKYNPDSFWKPYIDMLPEKYSTVLYFDESDLKELKPSPVFESSLKLCRSIARQYAYFYNKINSLDLPVLAKLQDVFTYNNYRWAVSTVMTRQNNIRFGDNDVTGFIPLWDMCNHEHGKITTDFSMELRRGECYALRDFKPGEQIFIFYGARSNADLFMHNGFVYSSPKNAKHDSLSLALGISSGDPLKEVKSALLNKLGLSGVTMYHLYNGEHPISAGLLAFIRIFNMNKEELSEWSEKRLPADLVSSDTQSSAVVGAEIDIRAFTYLRTRCTLVKSAYKTNDEESKDSIHRKNIKLLKECEVQIIDGAIRYLDNAIQKLTTDAKEGEIVKYCECFSC